MQKHIFFFFLCVTGFYGQAQNLSFFSNLGSNLDDRATNIFVGPNGSVYLLGQSSDTLFVPDNAGGLVAIPPISASNVFLTHIDNQGNHQWTKMFGIGIINGGGGRFTVNGIGQVIFLISADDYIKIDTDSIPCNGKGLNVLCKLDSMGNILSHKSIFNIVTDGAIDVFKTDTDLNLYIGGTFRTQLELLTNGVLDTTLSPWQPSKYGFILKYDSAGTRAYVKQMGNIINAFDFSGTGECNVLLEADHGDSLKIDSAFYIPADVNRQQYLVKLNSLGKNMLCKQIGGANAFNFRLMNMQHVQNTFEISAKLIDTVFIDAQVITPSIPADLQGSYEEIFSVQFDESTFQLTKAQSFLSYCELGEGIFLKANSAGSLKYLVYDYKDSTGYDTTYHQIIGDRNIMVKAFDDNYNKIWTKGLGSSLDDGAQGLELDSNGDAYVLGLFRDTMKVFDSLNVRFRTNSQYAVSSDTTSIISKGGADIFVGKITSSQGSTAIAKNKMFSFKVYPNPANDYIKILEVEGSYSLYDFRGNSIKTGNVSAVDGATVSMKELAAGMYFIRLTNKNGNVQCAKIIKE